MLYDTEDDIQGGSEPVSNPGMLDLGVERSASCRACPVRVCLHGVYALRRSVRFSMQRVQKIIEQLLLCMPVLFASRNRRSKQEASSAGSFALEASHTAVLCGSCSTSLPRGITMPGALHRIASKWPLVARQLDSVSSCARRGTAACSFSF